VPIPLYYSCLKIQVLKHAEFGVKYVISTVVFVLL
jgi:hypothetical protein